MNSIKLLLSAVFGLSLFLNHAVISAKEKNPASTSPVPFTATYDLYRGGIKMGESIYTLKRLHKNSYLLEGSVAPAGLIAFFLGATAVEKSTWEFINKRIQPIRYQYALKALTVNKKMLSIFDWTRLIATVTHNKKTRIIPIKPGDLDHALVPIAVMLDLKKGKLSKEYRYVDRRRIKKFVFNSLGSKWLQTSLGLFDTTLVETVQVSKKRNKIKRRTIFWAASRLDYLPVRISHQSGDGAEVVMTLTRLRGELGGRLKNK